MIDNKTFLLGAIFLVLMGIAIGYLIKQELDSGPLERLEQYEEDILYQSGYTQYNGTGLNYHLASIDGGMHWTAYDQDGVSLGDVEKVYPGLMEQEEAMRLLIQRVEESGPLDLTNDSDAELLKKALPGTTIEIANKTTGN